MLYLPAVMHQRHAPDFKKRWLPGLALALGVVVLAPRSLDGHEIPERVAVLGYVQVEGKELSLLLRVPLEAMRDVDFPVRADGSLDMIRVRALLPGAAELWLANSIGIDADGSPLGAPRIVATRVSLPSDRGFETLARALAGLAIPPLGDETAIAWRQAMFDVQLVYTIPSPKAHLVLRPRLAHLGIRTTSALHIVTPDGSERILTFDGNPERIALDPRWFDAAGQFIGAGFRHILGGLDHLLFVICLVLPVRRWRALVAIVTAFTLAHTLTLGASALGLAPSALWFPPLVEMTIAATIVWLTIENIVMPEERFSRRWMLAFAFGLVHGFGFSFALREQLQFAGSHLVIALASFNLGVELGQLLVLAVALPVIWLLRRHVGAARERMVTVVGSAIVAHSAWHWMSDRWTTLAAYRASFVWPALDATLALGLVRSALLLSLALALALGFRQILRTVLRP